jgi:hypothetical protein
MLTNIVVGTMFSQPFIDALPFEREIKLPFIKREREREREKRNI